jgi:hypothetical protein
VVENEADFQRVEDARQIASRGIGPLAASAGETHHGALVGILIGIGEHGHARLFQTGSEIVYRFFELLSTCHGFAPQRQDNWDIPTDQSSNDDGLGAEVFSALIFFKLTARRRALTCYSL